jgi:hypothetical protein
MLSRRLREENIVALAWRGEWEKTSAGALEIYFHFLNKKCLSCGKVR